MRRALLILLLLMPSVSFAVDIKAVDALLAQARVAYEAKQHAKALGHLDQALAQTQNVDVYRARIQFFRARCLINLHRPEAARSALERNIALSTKAEDKRRGRAWLAKVQRRFYGGLRVLCTGREVAVVEVPGIPRHCPAQWDGLLPGKYQIKITGGEGPKSVWVELHAGEVLTHNLDTQEQRRTKKPTPSQVSYSWGGALNIGLAQARGSVAQGLDMSPGVLGSVGLFAQALWPVGGLKLGPRVGLRYRHWRMYRMIDSDRYGTHVPTRSHGIRVPLLAHLQLHDGLSLGLGPAVEMVISASEGSFELATNSVAVAALAELGWRLPWIPDLTVSLRYELTAVDVFEEVDLRRDGGTIGLRWDL